MARVTKETLYLRHEFTKDERLEMGTKLAEAHNRIAEIEDEEKAMKAQIKERASGVELSIGTLSRNLSSGFTMENVDCELVYDLPNVGEVTYKRRDNGEVVKTRAMTAAENQTELEFAKAETETATAPASESVTNIEDFFGVNTTDAIKTPEEDAVVAAEEDEGDKDDDLVFSNPDPASAAEALKPEHDAAWSGKAEDNQAVKRGRGRPKKEAAALVEEPF